MKPEIKKSSQWKLSGWEGAEHQKKPVFSEGLEQTGTIARFGSSGHETYGIDAAEHKYFFKLNKKTGFLSRFRSGNKILSMQEVLAGAPWAVYFPGHASDSALVYSSKENDVVGTISQGIQDWYELSKDYPSDQELKPHRIYVKKEESAGRYPFRLTYKVTYPHPEVHQGDITHHEIEEVLKQKGEEVPSLDAADYIEKSFKAILDITAKRKHTELSHTLQRDCEFTDEKTDYYSLAGVMVYSHTNCEDDLHRENIIVINKEGKDIYHRIDFDMSFQNVTEKFTGALMGINGNQRKYLSRTQKLNKVKITPQSFQTFPIGIHEGFHFWPGVSQPVVGDKTIWRTIKSFLRLEGSGKGWEEPNGGDGNLTKQFTDVAYHPEFIKWKVYHYARYITTPRSIVEKTMRSRVAYLKEIRESTQSPSGAHFENEESANQLIYNLISEDSRRREKFKNELMKIPEFVNILNKNAKEYSHRLAQDNAVFQKKYGLNLPGLNEDFNQQYKNLEKIAQANPPKLVEGEYQAEDFAKKCEIYNEFEFKASLAEESKLSKVAKLIYEKRVQRNDSGLFTTKENQRFENITQEIITQRRIQQINVKINLAKTVPEIRKILKEAKTAFDDNTSGFTQIQKSAQAREASVQSDAAKNLQNEYTKSKSTPTHHIMLEFFKYAGGSVAVLLLAKIMLPHAVFAEIRILGVDVLRATFAHYGIVAGGVGILSATGLGFFSRNRSTERSELTHHLLKVFEKVMEICKAHKENLSDSNTHPSGKINELITKIKSGKSKSIEALKKEFEINPDDNPLLIKQLTELSQALVPYKPEMITGPAKGKFSALKG